MKKKWITLPTATSLKDTKCSNTYINVNDIQAIRDIDNENNIVSLYLSTGLIFYTIYSGGAIKLMQLIAGTEESINKTK